MSTPTEIITDQVSFLLPDEASLDDVKLQKQGFYWREHNGVKLLVNVHLENAGFVNGFSTRLGGVSAFPENDLNLAGFDEDAAENIEENRRRILKLFDGDYLLSSVWQIHSADVKIAKTTEQAANTDEKYDAVASDLKGVLVAAKTADCVPVLIGDPVNKAFAAVHAGWRGTVNSIVVNAVKLMQREFGSEAKDLICAIGPAAIDKYEVGAEVVEEYRKNFAYADELFTPSKPDHAYLNTHLANRKQLLDCGVPTEQIYTADICTMRRTDIFFSYRKEKKTNGKTGRLMSVIGLK